MRKGCSKGFTLIQLSVVISIISILITTGVRELTKVRNRARVIAAQSDVTTMKTAIALFEAEHNSYKVGTGAYTGVDGYESFKVNLKDAYGVSDVSFPDTINFYPTSFEYTGDDLSFMIKVKAKDSKTTIVLATPTQLSLASSSQEPISK